MPELPEVETIRRYLREILTDQTVSAVLHLDERMIKDPVMPGEMLRTGLIGQRVSNIVRRGKYLFIRWQSRAHLVIHLGMSGRLTWHAPTDPVASHTHLRLRFDTGELRLVDPRRFGRIGWRSPGEPLKPGLGVEPLSRQFTPAWLYRRIQGRRQPMKTVLLDQTVIAGLGNIYADEALYRAGIHPLAQPVALDEAAIGRLVGEIQRVLKRAIRHRGTSFSDYVDALGHPGQNQHYLAVYGRTGKPCPTCHTPIERMVIQGRSSHFCPACQSLGLPNPDQVRMIGNSPSSERRRS